MSTLPKGWTTKKLADLFTAAQLKHVVKILNAEEDDHEKLHKLKRYLNTLRESLIEAGVEPDYIAHWFIYMQHELK